MASSPPPGFHPPLPNPKKRPSLSASSSTVSSKKPRLSHPLRQTSFPAGDISSFYASAGPPSARSETGSITASVFSTTSASKPAPRGRGRPRKSATINLDDSQTPRDGTPSQVGRTGGRGTSVISGHTKDGGHHNTTNNADDDADNEDEDIAHYTSTDADAFKQFDEAQTQRRDRLKSVLDPESLARFEKWRSATLNKGAVRRLVNQIVSQSVTENPVQAVRVYAKWYVAEIVEIAREVQTQSAAAYDGYIEMVKRERQGKYDVLQGRMVEDRDRRDEETRMSEFDRRRLLKAIDAAKRDVDEYIPNPHRGGLLPDHLREALRRYRANGEGGGVGFEGLSHPLLGVHGSKVWGGSDMAGGKRLFR